MAVPAARIVKAMAVRRRPPRLSVAEVMGFSFERVTTFATLTVRFASRRFRLKAEHHALVPRDDELVPRRSAVLFRAAARGAEGAARPADSSHGSTQPSQRAGRRHFGGVGRTLCSRE